MTKRIVKVNDCVKEPSDFEELMNKQTKKDKNVEGAGSHYNPEFVEKVLRARASKGIAIKTEDLWK